MLANGKQMKARWNGVVRKGNCTLTQNSPSNFLVQDFQICIKAFFFGGGAVSSEKLFYTEKEDSVLMGRQSPSQGCLGTQWPYGDLVVTEFDGQLEICLSASILLETVICDPWQQRLHRQERWWAERLPSKYQREHGRRILFPYQVVSGHVEKQVQGRTRPFK